ncbi:phage tail tape measure protein [Clostridium tetani]|nr:phage tail tape measure protein [Clostridium tetani]
MTDAEAGNSFNSILINLTSGAGQAGDAMEKLGLSAFDSKGKFKGVGKVLLELKDKTKNMTEENRNMYLSMIGGKTQITTLQALLSGVGEEYGELRGKIKNSNGELEKMAKTMQDNNKGSITELKSALEELGLKIYDNLKPSIASLIKGIKGVVACLNSLSPEAQQTIVKLSALAIATGPVTWGLGKISNKASSAIGILSTLTGALGKTGMASKGLGKVAGVAGGKGGTGLLVKGLKGLANASLPAKLGIAAVGSAIYLTHKNSQYLNKSANRSVEEMGFMDTIFAKMHKNIVLNNEAMEELGVKHKKWNSSVSPETQKALEETSKRIAEYSYELKNAEKLDKLAGTDTEKKLNSKLDAICNSAISKIKSRSPEIQKTMAESFKADGVLNENENKLLEFFNRSGEEQIKKVQEIKRKILELEKKASKQQGDEKKKTFQEIDKLTKEIGNIELKNTIKSKEELLAAQADFNARMNRLDMNGVSSLLEEKAKIRDKEIDNIKLHHDKQIEMLRLSKEDMNEEEKKAADAEIKQLEEKKKQAIGKENEKYKGYLDAAIEKYPELLMFIDTKNGELLSSQEQAKQTELLQYASKMEGMLGITKTGYYKIKDSVSGEMHNCYVEIDEKTGQIKGVWDDTTKEIHGNPIKVKEEIDENLKNGKAFKPIGDSYDKEKENIAKNKIEVFCKKDFNIFSWIKDAWNKAWSQTFSNKAVVNAIGSNNLIGGEQYASGTTNAKKGWNLVGEKGPELLWFDGGETVLNNKDTMSLFDKLDSKIGYASAREWGINLGQGLSNGINESRGLVHDAALKTAEDINNKTRKTLGINSPSKVMMEIGKFINEGLGIGIEQNKDIPTKAMINIGNTIWDNSKQWSSKYGKDVTKILADTIKSNAYEPEEAAKTVGDKVNAIVKQKQDDLKKELDKMNIESKAKVDALQKQLRSVRNAETVGIRGTKKGTRYGIQDSYRAQKQAIEDKIKAVKDGCSKEVKAREEAVKKEIELIKKGGQQATEELKKESEARQKAVQDIDKLNDLIQKSLTRKIEKERDVALETAKLKAKESNLTKNQLESLLSYTKNYYDKKLERDKLQAQAEQLIMSKNQKAIVELLNNYGDLYQDSGMTLGQRMVGGMKSWTDMVPGIVNSAMGKVETSVQQTSIRVENSLTGIMNKIATVGKAMLGIGIAQPKKENSFDNIFSNWENTWQEDKEEDVAKKIADKYKEAFNRIELAQIELGRETKNSNEELKKQQATLGIHKDKLSTLKNKYYEMRSALGAADDEVVSLKKDIASLTIEIENQEQKLAVDTIRNEAKEYYEALELSTLKLTRETKNFNDELDLQKDLYINHVLKLGAMEEEYEKLKNILGENSDAVKQLERDIISFNNEMASFRKNANSGVISEVDKFNDKVKNALKARYESSLATEENYFNTRSESISKWKDENINAINTVYDARIKALDDGLKAEDRADKNKEELKRINRLKEAISFEHNEFNKAEMNKELSKLIADRNKRLHRESIEDEKSSLEQKKQNEINSINKSHEEQRRGLERQLQSTRAYYSEKLKLANLEAEAQKLIVENNQEEIIKLLKEYDKDYEEAGKTLGERLADGMAEQIYPILDTMIENIGDKLKNIRTNEIEKALSEVNYTALSSIPGNISNSTTNNSNTVVNNNNITFNSPKALSPSEQRRQTETTLRELNFSTT